MKKNYLFYIVLGVLIVVSTILFITDKTTSLKADLFIAIENIDEIKKVEIITQFDTFEVVRAKNYWYFNNGVIAREKALNLLLKSLNSIQIISPVSKKNSSQAIACFSSKSIFVKVYNDIDEIRNFVLTEDTLRQKTYLKNNDDETIFEIEAPGVANRILPLFRTEFKWWRTNTILALNPNQIKSIEIFNPLNNEKSFNIEYLGSETFSIKAFKKGTKAINIKTESLVDYLQEFRKIEIDEWLVDSSVLEKYELTAISTIKVENIAGNTQMIECFQIKNQNNNQVDINNMIVRVGSNQYAMVKYVQFDPILCEISYFSAN